MVARKPNPGDDSMFQADEEWEEPEYETAVEDEGYRIELSGTEDKPETFEGTFIGVDVKTVTQDDGSIEPVTLLLFKDKRGHRCNMWENHRLGEARSKGMVPGKKVKIVHSGKKNLDGGRSLNSISVYVGK